MALNHVYTFLRVVHIEWIARLFTLVPTVRTRAIGTNENTWHSYNIKRLFLPLIIILSICIYSSTIPFSIIFHTIFPDIVGHLFFFFFPLTFILPPSSVIFLSEKRELNCKMLLKITSYKVSQKTLWFQVHMFIRKRTILQILKMLLSYGNETKIL